MDKVIQQLALWNWRFTAAQAVVCIGVLSVFWKNIPPEVPLLYSRPWGTEQLVGPEFMWGLPVVSVLIGAGIGILAARPQFDPLLKAMSLATSLVIQSIVTLGLLRIVYIVT